MNIEEVDPEGMGFNPFLILKYDVMGRAEIDDYGTEPDAVAAYEKLKKILGESSRSRFEDIQLVRVRRHARVS